MATCFFIFYLYSLSHKIFDNSLVGIKVVINSSYSYSTVEHRKDDNKIRSILDGGSDKCLTSRRLIIYSRSKVTPRVRKSQAFRVTLSL